MARKLFMHPTRALLLGCLAGLILACGGGGGGGSTAPPTPLPAISGFTATPASITSGSSGTLAWTAAGATSLSLDQGVGSVTGLTTKTVSPAATTTYTLTASNAGGNATATATVTVVAAPVITSFTATPASILDGQSSTLAWTVAGASTLSLDQGIGTVMGTSKTVNPTITTTYTLTATNALGHATTSTATVTVNLNLGGTLALTYVPGSSVKLEQVIGDKDWADAAKGITTPTTSQTVTRFNVLGCGFGYSFEDNGKFVVLFGDSISSNPSAVNYHAHDTFAQSTSTDPESGLLLNFYTKPDGSPLFIEPPGVAMGADDIANCGISLPDGVYLICNTNANESLPDPHQNAYSVLSEFDETSNTFSTGRTISQLPGGHFIFNALHASGTDVFMFGMGNYRASDIFLSKIPATGFWAGAGTQYFKGFADGQATWSSSEADAVPVVQDNPLSGPGWPNDSPTVGNASVVYSTDLHLWLMTYDGGRQSKPTKGIYLAYATQPWGPWSAPQLIFNEERDNAWGVWIHNPNLPAPGDGLNGPVIGSNDPVTTPGGEFAPQLIERFTRVVGNRLRIYYLLSTWNPYTVVKMRSEFIITNP